MALGAVFLLLLNDHVLKASTILPQWLTGKLSDFAGLFFFPLLLVALVRALALVAMRPLPRWSGPWGWGAVLATGSVFTACKLWPAFNQAFTPWWGAMVLDPTDLWALPMLAASLAWMHRCQDPRSPVHKHHFQLASLQWLAVAVAAAASIATSPPRMARQYPMWQIGNPHTAAFEDKGLLGQFWVSRSGKTGLGVTLMLANRRSAPTTIEVTQATLLINGTRQQQDPTAINRQVLAVTQPPITLEPGQNGWIDLPVPFDNNDAWNQGLRNGQMTVTLKIDGQTIAPLRFSMQHSRTSAHHSRFHVPLTPKTDVGWEGLR